MNPIASVRLRFGQWPEAYRKNAPLANAMQSVPDFPKFRTPKAGELYSPLQLTQLAVRGLNAVAQRSPKLIRQWVQNWDDATLTKAKRTQKVEKQLKLRSKRLWSDIRLAVPHLKPQEAQMVLKALQDEKIPAPKMGLFHDLLHAARWNKQARQFDTDKA